MKNVFTNPFKDYNVYFPMNNLFPDNSNNDRFKWHQNGEEEYIKTIYKAAQLITKHKEETGNYVGIHADTLCKLCEFYFDNKGNGKNKNN